jgi:3',5'-cyclic-AMP phosphodiesterase
MKNTITFVFLLAMVGIFSQCSDVNEKSANISSSDSVFSFVFMTDIHIQPELNAIKNFKKVIDTVNIIQPDFVLTGGDLIMDALGASYNRADSLYMLYLEKIKSFNMPVYQTMGNHEMFGVYKESGVSTDNPLYGKKMYEVKINNRFYSFDHKNWHFIILDDIAITKDRKYEALVDSSEINWIKNDLSKLKPNTPIVVSAHIPFISSYPTYIDSINGDHKSLIVQNANEVLHLFKNYNLKLVLQGHLHYFEDINIANKCHFITGGAVSGGWWKGAVNYTKEGFVLIKVHNQDISANYVEYGSIITKK